MLPTQPVLNAERRRILDLTHDVIASRFFDDPVYLVVISIRNPALRIYCRPRHGLGHTATYAVAGTHHSSAKTASYQSVSNAISWRRIWLVASTSYGTCSGAKAYRCFWRPYHAKAASKHQRRRNHRPIVTVWICGLRVFCCPSSGLVGFGKGLAVGASVTIVHQRRGDVRQDVKPWRDKTC